MVGFNSLGIRYRSNKIPHLSQPEVEDLALTLIKGYNPDLLMNPQELNVDDFAEFFLELEIEYHYLSHNRCYYGMFVFNDSDSIPVYNPSDNSVRSLTNVQDTILLDCSLTEERNENLRKFTLIHECAHSILHRPYFSRCEDQLTLFEMNDLDNNKSHIPLPATMTTSYNGKGPRNFQSDHDWIEWQANSLASCLLMNNSSLSHLLQDYNLENCSALQKAVIINEISDTYEVSYDAARVRFEVFSRDYSNRGSLF